MNDAAYARQLRQLLPPGRLWNLESDSEISAAMLALAGELARVDARGVDLINEADPRTATETLADWERILALPDDRVLAIPGTSAGRRVAITQKFTAREGQNVAFFVRLALACGYTLQPASGIAIPVIEDVTTQDAIGGALLGGTAYYYRVSALSATGETLASDEVFGVTDVGTNTNQLIVSWTDVPGAVGYRIYGRSVGAELFLHQVGPGITGYIDAGFAAPAGALPTTDGPITKFATRVLRANSRCTDRCYDANWAYAMQLNVLSATAAALSHADFERVIRHVTHSHIVDVFNYI